MDLITTVGWAARLNRTLSLGIEGIGEDLEGFWDPRWQLSVAGGPTFHPAASSRTSDALRDLPPTTRSRGYAVRSTLAVTF